MQEPIDAIPGLRARQAALRDRFACHPDDACVVDQARTDGLERPALSAGRVQLGSDATAELAFGVHRAVGGTHEAPVPGDLLCAALASCQESSLRMIADVLGVRLLELRVSVRAEVDLRGTLGLDPAVPVGFQAIAVSVRLRPAPGTPPRRLRPLLRAAERACVVLQTLRTGVPVSLATEVL
jgi:uncharacterized OsmC-like protein